MKVSDSDSRKNVPLSAVVYGIRLKATYIRCQKNSEENMLLYWRISISTLERSSSLPTPLHFIKFSAASNHDMQNKMFPWCRAAQQY